MKKQFVYNPNPYRDEVKEEVKQIIRDILGIPYYEVTDASNLYYDLGTDSLDIIEIVMGVEKYFGISIPDKELFPKDGGPSEKEFTVDYCVNVVKKYINENV